ncbi:hypothetical protein [Yersinia intermedia]|uniref:hypothetical protein n=1 Tax=Yersinia intermedia TaxID=631 RepID=UPI0005DBB3E9|nr:hypothetical protein [Yersinia intermedia]CNI25323.1 Uncharacterised protein [Yersinia intermedia]
MEWRGIPFPETVERIVTNTSLVIDKIPKVYIDTGDNTWSVTATMIATILGSLIAGSIPAAIAWRTIKKSQESVEKDRAAQQISLDKDREAQLLIATRSFNAQVLSTNRQEWINRLRDIMSLYISNVEAYLNVKRLLTLESKAKRWGNGTQAQIEAYFQETLKLKQSIVTSSINIKLMLNSTEWTSKLILSAMGKIEYKIDNYIWEELKCDGGQENSEYIRVNKQLIVATQRCLKNEWKRVKKGN